MEKFVVPVPSPTDKPRFSFRNHRWKRSLPELEGRIRSQYRHEAAQLLLRSYSQVGMFPHLYHINGSDGMCPTHIARVANDVNHETRASFLRDGYSDLEFDSKGIYLASVTKSGCLTVHDFESLYCSIYGPCSGPLDDEKKLLLHIPTQKSLDVVRWNKTNQDEVACASRQNNEVLLYDIGYVSPEPVAVLERRNSRLSRQSSEGHHGFSDVAFPLFDKSRLLASGLDGGVHIWDRRASKSPCVELPTMQSQLNSLQLDTEDRIVFGASSNGFIYSWDLRGGRTSLAFQSNNQVYYPLLLSIKVSSLLDKIPSLKAQANILPREIFSIRFNPSCPYQLAFHLGDGWSGVLNINTWNVTHIHCPPPPWEDGLDISDSLSLIKKPTWLPTCSVFAVGSSSSNGIYFLDFYPNIASPCHVEFDDGLFDSFEESGKHPRNNYIPASEKVVVCAAHPLNGTVIAGTKASSLMVLSQNRNPSVELDLCE